MMSMFGMIFVLFGAASILVFGPGLIAAFVASSKGYRPWFWLLSLGPVGMLVIALKPSLGKAETPEEREAWETSADWTGGVLSGFTILPMFGFPLILVAGWLSYSSMAVAPPPLPAGPVVTETMSDEPVEALPAEKPESESDDPQNPSGP